jgi:hypothetical protein
MLFKKAGNTADGIVHTVAKVHALVTVEINGIAALATRHELGNADGASKRPLHRQWVEIVFAGEQQELFEFGAEKFSAWRVVESQRGEGFEDAKPTRVAAVFGLDANDGHNDLCRYAINGLGLGQLRPIFLPELDATIDAAVIQEARTIALPGALQR